LISDKTELRWKRRKAFIAQFYPILFEGGLTPILGYIFHHFGRLAFIAFPFFLSPFDRFPFQKEWTNARLRTCIASHPRIFYFLHLWRYYEPRHSTLCGRNLSLFRARSRYLSLARRCQPMESSAVVGTIAPPGLNPSPAILRFPSLLPSEPSPTHEHAKSDTPA
jgi:hypothetical protein